MGILLATLVQVLVKLGVCIFGVANVPIVLLTASQEHKEGESGRVATVHAVAVLAHSREA
jgi:hypothetical protein